MNGSLTDGFRSLIDKRWSEFRAIEMDETGDNFESIICALVRACQKGNLRAIQVGLDRLDGKIAAEIEVEYPKFYVRYPNATKTIGDIPETDTYRLPEGTKGESLGTVTLKASAADLDELATETEELPTGSLRVVLEKMLHSPKQLVANILATATLVDDGDTSKGDPYVKSVIVAGLMQLVHSGKLSAVFEVFDQLDGKVADKIKLLGSDVYLTRYDEVAPAGALKNADGVYEIAADNVTNIWATRLEANNKNRR